MSIKPIAYALLNGVALATQHPDTFEVPTHEEKAAVKAGDHVKLGFIGKKMTERMWVKVTGFNPCTGTLDNIPAFMDEVKYEDVVTFEPRNILSILSA